MKKSWALSFFLLNFFLVGCISSSNIDFKAETHKDIKKIIILVPPKKETKLYYYRYRLKDDLLSSELGVFTGPFGLLHTTNRMEENNNKNDLYNKLTAPFNFNADEYFVKKLTIYLRQVGYSVVSAPKNTNRFMNEYLDKQVYLDFERLVVGYYAESADATLKPRASVEIKLIKNQNSIYEKRIVTGEVGSQSDEIDNLGYKEEECYKNFDDLIANTNQSVERLKKALDHIAKHLSITLQH